MCGGEEGGGRCVGVRKRMAGVGVRRRRRRERVGYKPGLVSILPVLCGVFVVVAIRVARTLDNEQAGGLVLMEKVAVVAAVVVMLVVL